MKIKFLSIAFVAAAILAVSCDKKAEEKTTGEPAVQEVVDTVSVPAPATEPVTEHIDNDIIEVTGKVIEINQGKDGYTAKITTAKGSNFAATISIPNLDDPKQYRAVKVGDNITVKGVVTNLESDVLIRVKELK